MTLYKNLILTGIALAGAKAAANEIKQNRIYSKYSNLSTVGEGVALKNFVFNLPLNSDSEVKLDEFFKLYAKKGDIHYEVIDVKKGLENIISYLNKNLSLRDLQSRKERIATINHYKGLLEKAHLSDKASLNNLEEAIEDGVIDVKKDGLIKNGIWQIKNGEYILLAKSETIDGYLENSIPIILDIKTRHLIEEPYIKKIKHKPKFPVKSGREPSTRLMVGGYVGEREKRLLRGGYVGFGHGPFGFFINLDNSKGYLVEEKEFSLSRGRKGIGSIYKENLNSSGIGLEFKFGHLLIGGGINQLNYTTIVDEKIISDKGEVLKKNINSKSETEYLGRFYGGYEIPVNKRFNIRALGGYDKKGLWGGIGGSIKLGNKKPIRRERRK